MHWSVLDVFPVALLVLFLIGTKPVHPFREYNDCYLSRETGLALRGVFALSVILHHLSQNVRHIGLFGRFYNSGPLVVTAFFFLSGYGLMHSYMTQPAYRQHFLRRRLPKILLPFVLLTTVFVGFSALNGSPYSPKSLILDFIYGIQILPYSWYILCIAAFYVLFCLLMHLCKNKYTLVIAGMFAGCVVYIAFCIYMRYGSFWYRTILVLLLGMIWALYEAKILPVMHRFYWIISPLTWLLFAALLSVLLRQTAIKNPWISLLYNFALTSSFMISILTVTMKFRVGNPVLTFLGNNSLEIYLVQGFFTGLRSNLIYIQNDFLWVLLCFFGSITIGSAVHTLNTVLFKKTVFNK